MPPVNIIAHWSWLLHEIRHYYDDEIAAISSNDHVMHGWLNNAPVYTNDSFERNHVILFITGCDFCQTIKVATIRIHGMEPFGE